MNFYWGLVIGAAIGWGLRCLIGMNITRDHIPDTRKKATDHIAHARDKVAEEKT